MEQAYSQVYINQHSHLCKKPLSLSLSLSLSVYLAASSDSGATAASTSEECFLCDAPVDVKFEPCGHAILCHECAERAKKCLKCKV